MTLRHKNVSESGRMAFIDIGDMEFPVWVDSSIDLGEGKAILPSEIFIRTMDLREWWPFELVGWISSLKRWLRQRVHSREHSKGNGARMAPADDETIRQVEASITAAQGRYFKSGSRVGLNVTLREYIDMANVLISKEKTLLRAGAPMSWVESERAFRRMATMASPITAIMRNMLPFLKTPIVRPWRNLPHMSFVDWYGRVIDINKGYPVGEVKVAQAEATDEDFVPPVQSSEGYTQEEIPLETEAAVPVPVEVQAETPEILDPTTANDELGIHFNKPFSVEFQIQYRIHLKQPNPDLAAFVDNELAKRLTRTHCSCAGTRPDMLSIRYHAEDVATPVDKATSADALLGFPEFAQAIIDIIKARLEIEAKMKEMENRIV